MTARPRVRAPDPGGEAQELILTPEIGRQHDAGVRILLNQDYAIVQAGVLLAAVAFVTINMLADCLYAVIDPRVGAGA